jgi:hypothetical protein
MGEVELQSVDIGRQVDGVAVSMLVHQDTGVIPRHDDIAQDREGKTVMRES